MPGYLLDDRLTFLRQEVERWQHDGLVSGELAARILQRYPSADGAAGRDQEADLESDWPRLRIPVTPGMVLLYLGGLLVLAAAAMLLSQAWPGLGDGGRFALVALPTVALYAAGWALYRQAGANRLFGLAMLFFGALMVPYAIGLGAIWRVGEAAFGRNPGPAFGVMLAACAVHVATLALNRSPVLTLPYPFTFVVAVVAGAAWLTMPLRNEQAVIPSALAGAGLVLLAVGLWERGRSQPAFALMPNAVGCFATLGGLWLLGETTVRPGMDVVALIACLALIAASVAVRNEVYLMFGAGFLVINIFALGFHYFGDSFQLPVTLMLCGGLSMGVGFWVQRVRKGISGLEPELERPGSSPPLMPA
jgi:uncharacterized membrane protein